jgi:predicted DNA-binding protein (MmcQ/YjbR family)
MAKDINEAVRQVCLSLPETEEFVSHGSPNFRVKKGKIFAVYAVNTHGDGRIALWLNSPAGAQALHVQSDPERFFVPPYVGPRGWLGMQLDKGLSWQSIAELVHEAYRNTAPARLTAQIGKTVQIAAPTSTLAAEDFDPMQSATAQKVLKKFRALCLGFPETSEAMQFGNPIWRAGKKAFALIYFLDKRLTLGFWVGAEMQSMLSEDSRYRIPPYMGHNGWIALDVSKRCDWEEVAGLLDQSYRHFALKRMLAQLGPAS